MDYNGICGLDVDLGWFAGFFYAVVPWIVRNCDCCDFHPTGR